MFGSLEFDDFDQFVLATRDWNMNSVQLERGPCHGRIQRAVGENVRLGHASCNKRIHQRGAPPSGFRVFLIPAKPHFEISSRGRRADGDQLLVYLPDQEFDVVSGSDFDVYTFALGDEFFSAACERWGLPDAGHLLSDERFVEVETSCLRALQTALRQFFGNNVKRLPLRREEMEDKLLRILTAALVSTRSLSGCPPSRLRDRALRRALDYIQEFRGHPIKLEDLRRHAHASERTLRYAFLDHFGVSPKSYLQAIRLNEAHRELHRADPATTTVTTVARRWGFWHMSQFAADYKRLFGQLPSGTLRLSPNSPAV